MSRMVFRPLAGWPTTPTPKDQRQYSRFTAGWRQTVAELEKEVDRISPRDTLVILQAATTERDIRRDGMLRADSRVGDDGIIVSFDSRYGPLRYACDTYKGSGAQGYLVGWQANVRAVLLTLEALRSVDRYGAARSGEQYRGFGALPPGTPMGPAMTPEDAARILADEARVLLSDDTSETRPWGPGAKGWAPILHDGGEARQAYRAAAHRLHPDHGGENEAWLRVEAAWRLLADHHGLT